MQRMVINITVFVLLLTLLKFSGETVNYVFDFIAEFILLNLASSFITSTIVKE